jgi:hypothetical protein
VTSGQPEFEGEVLYGTRHERAIRLSGRLAEQGIVELRIAVASGASRVVKARSTDLPSELVVLHTRVTSDTPPLMVVVEDSRLSWRTTDTALAAALRTA